AAVHCKPSKVPHSTAHLCIPCQNCHILAAAVQQSDRPRQAKRNSGTMVLVHLHPSKHATALLSVPRDLKVLIPGHGMAKINAAYADGGPRLAVRTVQANLPGVRINHVVDINFKGFKAAVNKVGCVYADI